jgi:hypothetical protein
VVSCVCGIKAVLIIAMYVHQECTVI